MAIHKIGVISRTYRHINRYREIIGIEAKYLSRVFTRSERLQPQEYEGTGLGLNICKKILDKFGGNIWVKSIPGEGTTFFFSIPKNR